MSAYLSMRGRNGNVGDIARQKQIDNVNNEDFEIRLDSTEQSLHTKGMMVVEDWQTFHN